MITIISIISMFAGVGGLILMSGTIKRKRKKNIPLAVQDISGVIVSNIALFVPPYLFLLSIIGTSTISLFISTCFFTAAVVTPSLIIDRETQLSIGINKEYNTTLTRSGTQETTQSNRDNNQD